MHLFTFLNHLCECKLDLLGGVPNAKEGQEIKSLDQEDYKKQLEGCINLLIDKHSSITQYETKFRDNILASKWPSDSDVFIAIGVGTGIQNLFKTIGFDKRKKKKIFVIDPDKRTLHSEEPMRKWLERQGFVRTVAETAEHIAQDLRDGDYEKVCFIVGYAVLDKGSNDTLHRYGVVRVWRELNHIQRNKLEKRTVMVGHSYKTLENVSDVAVGWAYATIKGYETNFIITEDGIVGGNKKGFNNNDELLLT